MMIIFGNLKFFSKVHISRENQEEVIWGSRFDPLHEGGLGWGPWVAFGNTWGHAQDLSLIKFWVTIISLVDPHFDLYFVN